MDMCSRIRLHSVLLQQNIYNWILKCLHKCYALSSGSCLSWVTMNDNFATAMIHIGTKWFEEVNIYKLLVVLPIMKSTTTDLNFYEYCSGWVPKQHWTMKERKLCVNAFLLSWKHYNESWPWMEPVHWKARGLYWTMIACNSKLLIYLK